VHDGASLGLLEDLNQLPAAGFPSEVNFFEANWQVGAGWNHVHPDDIEIAEQRQQALAEIARDACHDESRLVTSAH